MFSDATRPLFCRSGAAPVLDSDPASLAGSCGAEGRGQRTEDGGPRGGVSGVFRGLVMGVEKHSVLRNDHIASCVAKHHVS